MVHGDIAHIVTCAFPSLSLVIKNSCRVRFVSTLGTLPTMFRPLLAELGRSIQLSVRPWLLSRHARAALRVPGPPGATRIEVDDAFEIAEET